MQFAYLYSTCKPISTGADSFHTLTVSDHCEIPCCEGVGIDSANNLRVSEPSFRGHMEPDFNIVEILDGECNADLVTVCCGLMCLIGDAFLP